MIHTSRDHDRQHGQVLPPQITGHETIARHRQRSRPPLGQQLARRLHSPHQSPEPPRRHLSPQRFQLHAKDVELITIALAVVHVHASGTPPGRCHLHPAHAARPQNRTLPLCHALQRRPDAGGAGAGPGENPQKLFTEAVLHGLRARMCDDVDALDRLPACPHREYWPAGSRRSCRSQSRPRRDVKVSMSLNRPTGPGVVMADPRGPWRVRTGLHLSGGPHGTERVSRLFRQMGGRSWHPGESCPGSARGCARAT